MHTALSFLGWGIFSMSVIVDASYTSGGGDRSMPFRAQSDRFERSPPPEFSEKGDHRRRPLRYDAVTAVLWLLAPRRRRRLCLPVGRSERESFAVSHRVLHTAARLKRLAVAVLNCFVHGLFHACTWVCVRRVIYSKSAPVPASRGPRAVL